MLHEILLSLWSCSTRLNCIVDNESTEFDKYLHPGEKQMIQKILKTVNEFNNIAKFIKKYTSTNVASQESNDNEHISHPGLYLGAFCDGMDESLIPFREDVVDLENIVLCNAHTPVVLIRSRLEKYVRLFEVLNSLIHEIEWFQLRGCKLFQCLHRYMHFGTLETKAAIEKIVHCVHAVFYKHLTSWLLYGHLQDRHKEFFIQQICEKEGNKSNKNDMLNYQIEIDMVPIYMGATLASKIFTIGQTVIMFSNDPREMQNDFTVRSEAKNLIWGEREYEYFQKLQNLQAKATFDTSEFEKTVDELKTCVTELLWRVASEEAQLFQQLRLIKDFYLLGRGDLYLEFIKLAGHILNKIPSNHSSRDVNFAFHMAIRKMHLNEETALESFVFAVPVTEKESIEDNPKARKTHLKVPADSTTVADTKISENDRLDPIEQRGWGLIILKYKIVWPLHLLFSSSALDDYNILFRFLLRVKKTQIDLSNLWTEQMRLKGVETGVTQLRNTLIFIIDNLQYYLQVDVLESQYTIMENSMKNTRNFEDVQKAHSIFLANVMSQTFLSGSTTDRKNSVNKLIRLLLRLCDDFILQASIWETTNLLTSEKEDLKTLTDTLDGLMDWLIKTLNTVRAQPSGEHLAQLLLRLDFNRWFSSKA